MPFNFPPKPDHITPNHQNSNMKTQIRSSTPNNENVSKPEQSEKIITTSSSGKSEESQAVELQLAQVAAAAGEKIIDAVILLNELRKHKGWAEIEAVRGFMHMADEAISGLQDCSAVAQSSEARERHDWPVMMELNSPSEKEEIDGYLKGIHLGENASGQISVGAIAQSRSTHKEVAAMLYTAVLSTVRTAMFNTHQPTADKKKEVLGELWRSNVLAVVKQLDGYDVAEWEPMHRTKFEQKVKELYFYPNVTSENFNKWFAACRALLVCITKDEFQLPRHKLQDRGIARAAKKSGKKVGEVTMKSGERGYGREGIVDTLKSDLKTALRLPRE
jgi:hypothetical protein